MLALITLTTQAQELTIKEMQATNDLSASQYRRMDRNNEPCGLVKVRLATMGAQFEGNVIPPVEYKTGEYWVYMSKGSRELHIKHPSFLPVEVHFGNYGLSRGIQSLTTYTLTLAMPQSKGFVETQKLTINYTPTTAMVLIDSKPYQGNGHIELDLQIGLHNYQVVAMGYETAEGSIKLTATQPRTITENLVATSQPVTVQKTASQPVRQQTNVTQDAPSEDPEIQGKTLAQICLLGYDYDVGRNGKTQNYAKALKLYRIAAEQGHAESQWRLGLLLRDGKGISKNTTDAIKWFRKSAEQGNVYGQYYLGYLYFNNKANIEALNYFKMAAEQGHAGAQTMLGYMYSNGYAGVNDYNVAEKWYRKAAEQGNASAQNNLGAFYEYGKGVPKDINMAKYWYEKAAAQGHEKAKKKLEDLNVTVSNTTSAATNSGEMVVQGTVYDKKSKEPIIGASIRVKDTRMGAVTDFNGNFKIKVPANDKITLIINYVGFKSQNINVDSTNNSPLKIYLRE